ncbi:unnamed protein product, partial [Iphiclides podalirius]
MHSAIIDREIERALDDFTTPGEGITAVGKVNRSRGTYHGGWSVVNFLRSPRPAPVTIPTHCRTISAGLDKSLRALNNSLWRANWAMTPHVLDYYVAVGSNTGRSGDAALIPIF